MNAPANPTLSNYPATWKLVLAFAAVYLSWGTTYLAIRVGVEKFPPLLFGGTRVCLAGLVLTGFLLARGGSMRMPLRELGWVIFAGLLLFLGGNGLITFAEKTVPSGVASVLVATTPLWIALLSITGPRHQRASLFGWIGLLLGFGGVLLLFAEKLQTPSALLSDAGPFLVLGSALCWAIGSLAVRGRTNGSHLAAAAYQMLAGGTAQVVLGLALGETGEVTAESFTPAAVYAFFHLLVVGSLIGFVAYNYLLGHVSATLVGTYAYVNPTIALVVGWLWGEELSWWVLGGMVVILAGVALVRSGAAKSGRQSS
jgi:drug/metabolite transporter (DMT)-like permease